MFRERRLLIDISHCLKHLVGNSEQWCCAIVISHSSSSPLKIHSFFLGTHAPLSHCLCWSGSEVEWDPHLGRVLFTNLEELCFFRLQLCVWEARFPACCSLSRPANISLVSFVHPLNERPRSTPALCSDLERPGRADVLVGSAASSRLLLSCCFAGLSREQWLCWLYFPFRWFVF